jgi:hypothetical protein
MSADQDHLTATALITEAPDVMTATVKMRTNYAVPHLLSAAILSRRLSEIGAEHSGQDFSPFWDEILAHATATVFLAVAASNHTLTSLFIDMNQNFLGVRQSERPVCKDHACIVSTNVVQIRDCPSSIGSEYNPIHCPFIDLHPYPAC